MVQEEVSVDGIKFWASRSGYTGEDGFEIGIDRESDAVHLAEILAKQPEVHLGGLGSRDSLRLESGLCLYGNDMNEDTTPIEASLGWVIKKDRWSGGFVGADKICPELKDRKKAKPHRRVGLIMTGKAPPPRQHCKVFDATGKKALGEVTSGTHSLMLNTGVAMAYMPVSYAGIDPKACKIEIRGRLYPAKTTKMPFWPTHFYRG
jgi:aminomethyltransferase